MFLLEVILWSFNKEKELYVMKLFEFIIKIIGRDWVKCKNEIIFFFKFVLNDMEFFYIIKDSLVELDMILIIVF